jgi:hypothetical protein
MSAHKKKKKEDKKDEFHVDESELQALSERIAQRKIEDGDWDTLSRYLALVLRLSAALQFGRIKMKRITRMLFGKRTEKEKKKDPPEDPKPPISSEDTSHNSSDAGKQQKGDEASTDEGNSEKTFGACEN